MTSQTNCRYCNKNYSSKYALKVHVNTSKTCMSLRGDVAENMYKCECCDFVTTVNSSYERHCKTCKGRINIELTDMSKKLVELELIIKNMRDVIAVKDIELKYKTEDLISNELVIKNLRNIIVDKDLELQVKNTLLKDTDTALKYRNNEIIDIREEIKEYKNHILKLSERPTIDQSVKKTNTHINLAPIDLSVENITKKIQDKFTLDHISIKGVVQFLIDNLINPVDGVPTYLCSDASRSIFKYKSIDGKINKDIKATKLIDAIKDPIRDKSIELAGPETQRLFRLSCESQDPVESSLTDVRLNTLSDGLFSVKYLGDNRIEFSNELATRTSV